MVQSQSSQRNTLHELGYKIFLDRYAQKDMTRSTLTVGDTVIVVVDSRTGQREIGRITALKLPKVTVELLDGDVVERDVEHVDKPLELDPGQMMDRVAAGIAAVEATPELKQVWTERFRWLLEDWKFVPAGRILTAAGTDQQLTFYNCMPPEQEILTAAGYRPIADVRIGDLVVTHRNRLRPVRHKLERETEEALYIIRLKKVAYDDLRVTGDHKVYAIRAEWVNKHKSRDGLRLAHQPDWIPAKELHPGDYVSIAYNAEECPPEVIDLQEYLPAYAQQDGKLFKATTRGFHGQVEDWGTHASINAQVQIDAELCYVFGRWLGDGCITHRTGTDIPSGIKIVFGLDEKAEAEELARLIEAKFGIAASLKLSSTERWYDLWVNSMLIGQFFKAFLGAYSHSKRIPDALMRLPDELTLELLRGLFSADGYISDDKLGIVLSNRSLSVQVHQLLLRLGFLFSIRENTPRLGRVPAFRVQATASECAPLFEHFFSASPPMPETDAEHYFEHDGLKWLRIDEIAVEDYSGIVMDIEVEEDHSFVSAGVVVSNCYVIPSPKDSRGGIIETLRQMTEIMSRGGGVGINVSSLRPRHAYVKGVNGRSSGAVSWGALYSFVTGLIEQGGCFGPNERIATDRGLIPAAELADRVEAGEAIYAQTHKGLRRITARFRNGVKPLFELRTKRGFKVQITEDHKVAVLMDGEIVTMPLKYLAVGDEVLLLLGSGVPENDAQLRDGLDEDLAYLFGYSAAGGSLNPSQAQMLESLTDDSLLDMQRLPEAIFRSSSSVQLAFVAGYAAKSGGIESRHEQIIADLQQILSANGIISRAERDEHSAVKVYRLHVDDVVILQRLSTSVPTAAQAETSGSLQVATGAFATIATSDQAIVVPDTIEAITPLTESEVYDFEVDDVHLLSGSGVYTSNSRRGALMLILNDWHPDVFDFINSKRKAGQITNANISVGVSDKLMEAVRADGDWDLVFPDTSDPAYDTLWDGDLDKWVADGRRVIKYRTVKARAVWNAIIESAWASAEPGVFFRERYNKMSNSWYFAPIISTNPCGEQGLPAFGVCNLGALNLARFYDPDKHDVAWDELDRAARYATRFLDNVIDSTPYFFEENYIQQSGERRVGLNNMGLAELLIRLGIRYGSDESVAFIDKLYGFLARAIYETSIELAREKGPFPRFDAEKFLQSGFMRSMPEDIREKVRQYGIRNVTLTTQAPTGCVAPDTLVSTASGLRPIIDLGDPNGPQWQLMTKDVHTDVGVRKASHFYVNGFAPVKTITTQRGFNLTATHNHRVRVIDSNGDYVWRRMDEITLGDRVVLKKGTLGAGEPVTLTAVEQGNRALSKLPSRMTPQFAEMLGLYMGDGYTKARGGLHIVVSQRDPDLLQHVQDLLREVWGQDRQVSVEERVGCWVANLTGYYIPRFFEANGLAKPRGNHGEGAEGAFIPTQVLRAGKACVAAFLRGLFESDGSITRGTITLASTSRQLVQQAQIALLGLGIVAALREMPPQQNSFGSRTKHELRIINRREAERFVHEVGFISARKRAAAAELGNMSDRGDSIAVPALVEEFYAQSAGLKNDVRQQIIGLVSNGALTQQFVKQTVAAHPTLAETRLAQLVDLDIFLDEVASIEDGESHTYDISVPDNHTYIANGFVSHNTTGTMVNTSTGIEPFFSWVYYRKSRLGLHEEQVPLVKEWHAANPGAKKLPDYFVTAMDLTPEEHVKVQGAIQRWVDSSISKTCNVPNNYTIEQVSDLYMYMYELGCKGGTIYRDGSRDEQVLMLKGDDRAESEMASKEKARAAEKPLEKLEQVATPHRVYPRPKRLAGVTVSRKTPFGTAYITMNSDEHGNPFEVFITVGKAGSDLQADAEGLGRMISLGLRTTAPQNRREMLKLIIDQLQGIGGSRAVGMGSSRVMSLPDAVAGALMEFYFPPTAAQQLNLPMGNGGASPALEAPADEAEAHNNGHVTGFVSGADICPECKMVTLIKAEGCEKCLTCGYSRC